MKRCKHYRVCGWRTTASGQTTARFECNNLWNAQLMKPALITCQSCNAVLSLGPANDSVKPAPLPRREMANFRDHDAWSWDISRPIAEQLAETARVDAEADALTTWRDWAKDNMISHEEYEATRDAEPDCRDEHDPTTKFGHLANQVTVPVHETVTTPDPGRLAHALAADGHDAETIREHTGLIEVDIGIADVLAVCSCFGDALIENICEVAS